MKSHEASPRPRRRGSFLVGQLLPPPSLDAYGWWLKAPVAAVVTRSTIMRQPSPRPPLDVLHKPHRTRVKGVSSAYHEEVGGHHATPPAVVGPLRTHDPKLLHADDGSLPWHTTEDTFPICISKAYPLPRVVTFSIIWKHTGIEIPGQS